MGRIERKKKPRTRSVGELKVDDAFIIHEGDETTIGTVVERGGHSSLIHRDDRESTYWVPNEKEVTVEL